MDRQELNELRSGDIVYLSKGDLRGKRLEVIEVRCDTIWAELLDQFELIEEDTSCACRQIKKVTTYEYGYEVEQSYKNFSVRKPWRC